VLGVDTECIQLCHGGCTALPVAKRVNSPTVPSQASHLQHCEKAGSVRVLKDICQVKHHLYLYAVVRIVVNTEPVVQEVDVIRLSVVLKHLRAFFECRRCLSHGITPAIGERCGVHPRGLWALLAVDQVQKRNQVSLSTPPNRSAIKNSSRPSVSCFCEYTSIECTSNRAYIGDDGICTRHAFPVLYELIIHLGALQHLNQIVTVTSDYMPSVQHFLASIREEQRMLSLELRGE
jgi:hypothetical protein